MSLARVIPIDPSRRSSHAAVSRSLSEVLVVQDKDHADWQVRVEKELEGVDECFDRRQVAVFEGVRPQASIFKAGEERAYSKG